MRGDLDTMARMLAIVFLLFYNNRIYVEIQIDEFYKNRIVHFVHIRSDVFKY